MKCSPGGPALLCFLAASLHAATIEGTVTDAAGRPLENARIEHTGKMVVATSTSLALRPSADEIRTDASGHFRVDTDKPAFVVRKPGYQSIRVMVANDAKIVVTLSVVASPSRCRLPAVPSFKTKAASDVDYQVHRAGSGTTGIHRRNRADVLSGCAQRLRRLDIAAILRIRR